ncbi:siderophore-interacting protein [Streptomyces fructofermentans]|uniref:siderophore-interacting protein n=1 Tax=Streptomyces fructofermentans TaxID=152141 RepID=UPI0033D3D1BF
MAIHRAEVASVRRLSETMTRVTLHGDGLAGFTSTGAGDEYVRVFLPHGTDRGELSLPEPVDGGGWRTPEGRPEAPMRTYTIRAVRPEAGEVDIDFVRHDHGAASEWAAAARPGDPVGLTGPTALYRPPADLAWQLLVTDLTGLPAAARLLEQTPEGVRSRTVVEVPGPSSRLELPARPGDSVTWEYGGNGHGPSRLAELVAARVPHGADLTGGYVWVAGQTGELRTVRRYLRKELGLATDRFKVVGYWMPEADSWRRRYDALPAEVKTELTEMWEKPTVDTEDLNLTYEERLGALGL